MADRDHPIDVPGVAVGNWTDLTARTGCTVVLFPDGAVAAAEVRGGAPASRELAMLQPDRTVDTVDAVVLTGGSAFGLAAADGVMAWLESNDKGWPTPAGRVPIVPTLALFDLAVGDSATRPGPDQGRTACENASSVSAETGTVGAGAGCTTQKWLGPEKVLTGGLVAASTRSGDVIVAALIAVNAWGSVGRSSGDVAEAIASGGLYQPLANTTIGVVVTNAQLDKTECLLLAQSAHDGLARSVFPAHGRSDGDAFVAASVSNPIHNQMIKEQTSEPSSAGAATVASTPSVGIDVLRMLTTATVERAILKLAT